MELVVFVLLVSATEGSFRLLHGVRNVQDLGSYGGITKDSVHIRILHCVTGQIFPVFQRIIVPLKHCELFAQ